MSKQNVAKNALNVSPAAENILVGIALRYELLTGQKVNWRKDQAQCIQVVRDAAINADLEIRGKAKRFWESLSTE